MPENWQSKEDLWAKLQSSGEETFREVSQHLGMCFSGRIFQFYKQYLRENDLSPGFR